MIKRGVSSVITTVLMVLLALVAISAVWVFLRPFLVETTGGQGEGSGRTEQFVSCVDIDIKAISCSQITAMNYEVVVQRGAGERNLENLLFVWMNGTKNVLLSSENSTFNKLPGEFGTEKFVFSLPMLSNVESVNVAPIIDGKTCEFSYQPSQCSNQIADNGDTGSGEGSDEDYLYDTQVEIFQKSTTNTNKTFTVKYNNEYLRRNYSDENFYVDFSNGGLKISYDIIPKKGGVDIIYTINNPSSVPQLLPEFRVEGVIQSNNSGDNVKYLMTKSSAGFKNVDLSKVNNIDKYYPTDYYSPIIITKDSNAAVGAMLEYPYLQYKHNVMTTLTLFLGTTARNGTFGYRFRGFADSVPHADTTPSTLAPGRTENYILSLRFASPRNSVFTAYPYKEYFNSLYGNNAGVISDRDLRPMRGIQLGDGALANQASGNPRGYRGIHGSDGRIDVKGWGPFTDWFIQNATTMGFRRVMIWLPGGAYDQNKNNNFPPQFMSDWLPNASNSDGNFSKYALNGIQLGFWWGRSTNVPKPNQWNAAFLENASFDDTTDKTFMENEATIAKNRGAEALGLDQFTQMPVYHRSQWIDRMKVINSAFSTLMHESSGPDLLHRKIANYAQPSVYGTITGPDLLAWYLNPGSEIYVQLDGADHNIGKIIQLISWGYTPLPKDISVSSSLNINGVETGQNALVECFNGDDDDKDGLIDLYDLGCDDLSDNSE